MFGVHSVAHEDDDDDCDDSSSSNDSRQTDEDNASCFSVFHASVVHTSTRRNRQMKMITELMRSADARTTQ